MVVVVLVVVLVAAAVVVVVEYHKVCKNMDNTYHGYECFTTEKYRIGNASLSSFIVGVTIIIFVTSLFIVIRKNYVLSENTHFHAFFLPIYNYPVTFIIIISVIIGIINIIGKHTITTTILLLLLLLHRHNHSHHHH